MNLHSKFCYCYIPWTCICIIHLSEGALLLYYMYILYFTPTWRYLAIVLLYCIGLYTYLRGPCFYTILYSIVQDTYLRGPCYCSTLYYTPTWGCLTFILYCTILYKTPTWGVPAIVLVTWGGGRLSHFHQLSKLFYSILCPNIKLK